MMSELKDNVSKMNIRGQANLIFSMMRFMVTVLDLVQDNPVAQDTLTCMAVGISRQADILQRDTLEYVEALSESK